MEKANNKYYLLLSGGILIVIWFIWARFIVDRLPKFIPFNLTLLTLSLLIFTCIIYVNILKQLFRPRVSILIQALIPIGQKIYTPLYTLDFAIRSNLLVRKVIYKIASQLSFHTVLVASYKYYRIWNFTPRLLLLFAFYVDVFYFHKLGFFYSFLFLSAIPLIGKYLYYLMAYLYETELEYLEQWYEVRLIPTNPEDEDDDAYMYSMGFRDSITDGITIRAYLWSIIAAQEPIKYECALTSQVLDKCYPDRPWRVDKPRKGYYNITEEDYAVMSANFDNAMPALVNLHMLSTRYTSMFVFYSDKIKRINLIIFSLFLIAWVYILMVSLPTFMLTANEFEYLAKLQERWEPFSGILI